MAGEVRTLTQGLKPGFLCVDFSARLKSCPDTRQKQVLRSAYPNFVGAPVHPTNEDLFVGTPKSCSAQDDRSSSLRKISKVF